MIETSGQVAYFCSYFPREIIYALGKVPARALPAPGMASVAESYVHRNSCALVKALLGTYLQAGASDGLEGAIFTDSCDAIRRMRDVWEHYLDVPALDFIDVPRLRSPLGVARFASILEAMAQRLERRWNRRLDVESLAEAVHVYEDQGKLLEALRRARAEGRVGSEEHYVWVRRAAQEEPAEVNKEIGEMLGALPAKATARGGPRILLIGSMWVRPDVAATVEEAGGRVIFEDTCSDGRIEGASGPLTGGRGELIRGLASRYLGKPPCPRMRDLPWRLGHLAQIIRREQVEGAICCYYKFCDLFLGEYPALNDELRGLGCPTLLLEDDGEAELSGQQRTRIQAFLEMM